MAGGLTIGQYIPGDSVLHRLDPRIKIISLLLAITAVMAAAGWVGFVPVVALSLGAIALSGFSVRSLFRGLRALWLILLTTLLIQLFLTPGEILWGFGPLKITHEGLTNSVQLFLRLVLLIILASLLTQTTTPVTLTAGMESLLAPLTRFGVPAHELALMMNIAMGFVPTLQREAGLLMKAQRARGAGLAGGPAGWVKNMLPVLVPLFAVALRRGEDLAVAMEARCYRGGVNRTGNRLLPPGRADYMTLAVCLAVLAGTIVLRFYIY
ncbi:MAG: energy-coupling factor transporter transmembrane protein EcfT [Peptococcaceae bacterium]|jgi:energy-coupling factor transport system permease protein|nr:energy-coupling factor transporter transmembrane protein EcfT [Peptococcaceae bacterium]